jgi:hypothetical protein
MVVANPYILHRFKSHLIYIHNMKKILEIVTANIITIGILIAVVSVTAVEVKREYFFNGISRTQYRLRFG